MTNIEAQAETRAAHPLPSDAGMTLIEMLIALAIIAIMGSLSILSLGASSPRLAQIEARKLAARLDLVLDAAITEGRRFRFSWDEGGYTLQEQTVQGNQTPQRAAHKLRNGLTLKGPAPSGAITIDWDGAARPAAFVVGPEVAAKGAAVTGSWQVQLDGFSVRAQSGAGK